MTCRHCHAPTTNQWSAADAKGQRFTACDWQHAWYAVNVELVQRVAAILRGAAC